MKKATVLIEIQVEHSLDPVEFAEAKAYAYEAAERTLAGFQALTSGGHISVQPKS